MSKKSKIKDDEDILTSDPQNSSDEYESESMHESLDEEEPEEYEEGEENDELTKNKVCYAKNLNKDFIVLDEDDSNIYEKMEYIKIENEFRITDPIMTYYEMVRILGTRAQQFNLGSEPLVKGIDHLHPAKMAYIELITKMTPYIIRRHLPGKKYEDWKVNELEIIHEITDSFFIPENFDWNTIQNLPKIN